ncbi:MAG: ABC transporter ATP-binding protein [Leptospirales bacterium]|jgi:ATP-binding cassette subfamily B protein
MARSDGSLWRYIAPYRGKFFRAGFASIVNKILDLMPPLLVGWVIDTVRREPPGWLADCVSYLAGFLNLSSEAALDDPFILASVLAGLAVVIFALESFFQWWYRLDFMVLAQRVQHDLRVDAYDHMQRREIEFFENHRLGETMVMLNDDVNQLERFLNGSFSDILQLLVLIAFSSVVMFGVSWELSIVGCLPIPVILYGSLVFQRKITPRYRGVRQSVGHLNNRLENNIGGIQVIKSFTAEAYESERVRESSSEYSQANFHAIRLRALYVPLIRMAVAIGFAGVLLLGSYWVLTDPTRLSVGSLVLFSMLIQRLLWPLTRLGNILDELERARASARRTLGLLNSRSLIQDPPHPKPLGRAVGELEFRDVLFQYRSGVPVLDGLSFRIRPGESVGIAGATGAGKSTLIKLLLRFYDPTAGQVLLDGLDLPEMTLFDLRKNIALVSQDVYLFHGTIAENIAYGRPRDVSGGEVRAAAELARLHAFVETLPEGYETIVGERGIKLSGGQRQRLSIARAILKDAPIMVFDEATSSVDTETEREIQNNLDRFTAGKTALVIAHRLSTIRGADRILVLKDGRLAEEGHHDRLVELDGVYADLWRIQSGQAGSVGPAERKLRLN